MNVSAKQLRANLKHYLDKLERGEEIVIIRHSTIIGRLVPEHPAPPQSIGAPHKVDSGKQVIFRQSKPADKESVKQLHKEALKATGAFVEDKNTPWLDLDLEDIGARYINLGGDFLVGEIVAMGGFSLGVDGAELKRMRVKPDLQGQGIGGAILQLLEDKARQQDYKTMLLDTTDKQPVAQKLYESHGYRETRRVQEKKFTMIYYQKEL